MEFYNERRGIVARYRIEAPLPGAAVLSGRHALHAEYPSMPQKGRLSLFQQAERVGGQDASEWVLYRIMRDDAAGTTERDASAVHGTNVQEPERPMPSSVQPG